MHPQNTNIEYNDARFEVFRGGEDSSHGFQGEKGGDVTTQRLTLE
jgi:hypothetical protein